MLRNLFLVLIALGACIAVSAQTPVVMSSQNNFTYSESFGDVANWTFSTAPVDGTFTAGTGAAAWKGLATNATGTIPDGKKVTTATTTFATGSGGGVQKGTGNLVLLSTGTSDNTTAVAIDFLWILQALMPVS